jgi:hypothetical protein
MLRMMMTRTGDNAAILAEDGILFLDGTALSRVSGPRHTGSKSIVRMSKTARR